MKSRRGARLALIILVTTLLAACGPAGPAPANPTGPVIKIGTDFPTSGGAAADGILTRNGAELAIEQANAAGGLKLADGATYRLEMFALDDAVNGVHSPDQGARNAQAFVADPQVLAVIGPFNSNVARAMMPILNSGGLAHISPSAANETLTRPEYGQLAELRPTGKVTFFRLAPIDDIQGPLAADYLYDTLAARKIYILDDTETYGKNNADKVARRFKTRGGLVLGHEGVPRGTSDFRTIMQKIAALQPDALYYGGVTANGLAAARKQMVEIGLNVPFFSGGIVEEVFVQVAGEAAVGSYGTGGAANPNALPAGQAFLAAYQARFGAAPGVYSVNAYEAVNLVLDALRRAGRPQREAVRAALAATKSYQGVLGTTGFDEQGDTSNPWLSFYTVKDGQWRFVEQRSFTK